ncbi:MAG: hypothetical protein KAH68_01405 [Draconibacterium sp.]|nr:hypothetical protein [Draconibacterium sp.]
MEIKKYISKKLILRLAFFVAIISVATLFDLYFENNPEKLKLIQTESADNTDVQGSVYFATQTNTFDVKTSSQKNTRRKLHAQSHAKFVQKYYQLRNFQILKAEVQTQTSPLILSYHYLVFKNYFFSAPDDDPLIS